MPTSILSYPATVTSVETLSYSVNCSLTLTENRSVVVDGTAYDGGQKAYSLIGTDGRTDIAWTFTQLPVTALTVSVVTMVITRQERLTNYGVLDHYIPSPHSKQYI